MRRFGGGNPELLYFQFFAEGFYSHHGIGSQSQRYNVESAL